jgi:hypothetical protein
MSTLVNATNVVFFGDVVELEDRYTCGIEQVFKNTVLEAFIVQSEPSGSATYGWIYVDGQFVAKEAPYVPVDPNIAINQAANKKQAMELLNATDWTEVPSVTDTAHTPHLTNGADFIAYRVALRGIAVNPPSTPATFPTKPTEAWSTQQ